MPSWFVEIWDKFSIWVTNQPTFVEVAVGIGLFYVSLQIVKLLYKFVIFLVSPLLARPVRTKKQKDLRPKPRSKRAATQDDDSPQFVFR